MPDADGGQLSVDDEDKFNLSGLKFIYPRPVSLQTAGQRAAATM